VPTVQTVVGTDVINMCWRRCCGLDRIKTADRM